MRPLAVAFTLAILLVSPQSTNGQSLQEFWDRFALRDYGPHVLSFKYLNGAARTRILEKSQGGADLPFINRVIVRIERDAALGLEGDPGVVDVELFGSRTADRTFHKLLELYRVYLYQVSGRFNISAVNFSQGIAYWDRNSDERGDRTIAEALEVLATHIAPVLVAVGDGAELGVGAWAMAPSALPVVATTAKGRAILANSARPQSGPSIWRTVLYADGEPTNGPLLAPSEEPCGEGAHLTVNQMLHPESAAIPKPGGSSYATFKATWNICFIQQYSEVLRVQLRARTPVGQVEVEPFVAYYVDSPVKKSCDATRYRWADGRFQTNPPTYDIRAADKVRLDGFVNGHSIELRANFSIPLLKEFLNHLPPHSMTSAETNERYVSSDAIITMLKGFRLLDLVEVAANRRNIRFDNWKKAAEQDSAPVISTDLVDEIVRYCKTRTQFLVLSDEATPFFSTMP